MAMYEIRIRVWDDGRLEWRHDVRAEQALNDDQRWVAEAMHDAYHSVQAAWDMGEEAKLAPIRERQAQAAQDLLDGESNPKVRSITRRLA